jgi:hypothetical protein
VFSQKATNSARISSEYADFLHSFYLSFINKQKAYSTSDKDVADWLEGKGEKPDPK